MKPEFKFTLKVNTKLETKSNFLHASSIIDLNFKMKTETQ